MRGCLPSSSKQKKATFLMNFSCSILETLCSSSKRLVPGPGRSLRVPGRGCLSPKKAFDENEACGRRMPIPAQAGMLGSNVMWGLPNRSSLKPCCKLGIPILEPCFLRQCTGIGMVSFDDTQSTKNKKVDLRRNSF